MVTVRFFKDVKELCELTHKTSDELWDAGFNLDDMDAGFEVDWEQLKVYEKTDEFGYKHWSLESDDVYDGYYNDTIPQELYYVLELWDNYCVGPSYAKLGDKTYVTLHHA